MKIILKEDEKYSCDEYIGYILDITFNQSLKIKSGVSSVNNYFDKSFENNFDDEVLKLLNDDKITFKVEEWEVCNGSNLKEFERWLNFEALDEELRKEINNLSDEAEIEDRFYTS